MPPFARLPLSHALRAVYAESLEQLRAEFPDERIEYRPAVLEGPRRFRCIVNHSPVGPLLDFEDVVGLAVRNGRTGVVRQLVADLSDEIMLWLQTAA